MKSDSWFRQSIENARNVLLEHKKKVKSMSPENKKRYDAHKSFAAKHDTIYKMTAYEKGQEKICHESRVKCHYHNEMAHFYVQNNRAPTDAEKRKMYRDSENLIRKSKF